MSTSHHCDPRYAGPIAEALDRGVIRPSIGMVLGQMSKRDQMLYMEDAREMTLNQFEVLVAHAIIPRPAPIPVEPEPRNGPRKADPSSPSGLSRMQDDGHRARRTKLPKRL